MKVSQIARLLPLCLLLLITANQAKGYALLNLQWPAGSNVVVQLQLGPTTVALQDGAGTWNASAADALDIWNGYLDFISLSSVSGSTAPEASGDGLNSVFFSNTIFGDSFGEALAVTVLLTAGSNTSETGEADVVVNSAYRYDSYRGREQLGVYDFHRIVLHEFGHVLGLDHVMNNPTGQALMEPIISDLDHLAADDIGGVRQIYGAELSNVPASGYLRAGDAYVYSFFESNNSPISYSAIGLPPGITIDSTSGDISGTATTTGVYDIVITAHGPIADAYGAFRLTVRGFEEVPGLLAIVHLDVFSMVADPIRPRIYTAGPTGINMIDADTFKVTNLVSGYESSARLSLSADSSVLMFTNPGYTPVQLNKIDLASLSVLPALPIPGNFSAVLEGLDNRDYVAGPVSVFQFDAITGALQEEFVSGYNAEIAISTDRNTLFLNQFESNLSAYDITTPHPILVSQLNGTFNYTTISPDGHFLYCVSHLTGGQAQSIQIHVPELSSVTPFASGYNLVYISVGVDGSIYQSNLTQSYYVAGSISVYNPVSLQLTSSIDLGHLTPGTAYQPSIAAFDNSGKYFFVSVSPYGGGVPEVWVFSTDLASFPPPPTRPTKNLLNVSTRTLVQEGEDTMIGGFIVQGNDPKKVLIRGLGPSLPLTGALSNPVLDLYDSSGKLLASNDDWTSDRLNIIASQLAPSSERESAILVTLQPGAYTAIVQDLKDQSGLALVEVYDLDPVASRLANISTRGKVETADDVMIGGFIIGGADPGPADTVNVLVRAIGPSLVAQGVLQPLADPTLELYDGYGDLVSTNDNWRSTQQADIIATGIPPTDDRESAILATLLWGNYTAIVRGQNSATGVALVEVYNLDSASAASK